MESGRSPDVGRALIVEDNPTNHAQLVQALQQLPVQLDTTWARTYAEARRELITRHYDIAFVDLVLDPRTEPHVDEWGGVLLVDDILELGLRQDLRVVVLTSFPRYELMRLAFLKGLVNDFITKGTQEELSSDLAALFKRERMLGLACRVTFTGDHNWAEAAQALTGVAAYSLSSAVSPESAEAELRSLVRHCFEECESVVLTPLTPGRGGTSVYRADRRVDGRTASASVVKIGPREVALQEVVGWNDIREYLSSQRSTRLEASRLGPFFGALRYSLLGAAGAYRTFGDFYASSSTEDVLRCLDGLFTDNLSVTRDPGNRGAGELDLTVAYTGYLKLRPDAVSRGYEFKFGRPVDGERLYEHRDIDRALPNAVHALAEGGLPHLVGHGTVMSHGDLHGDNILVGPDGAAWLIDFGAAGASHWARDYVLLETYIRFRLLHTPEVADLYQFERYLAEAAELGTELSFDGLLNGELRKAGLVISRLRRYAAEVASGGPEPLMEYNFALLMTTLKYMQLHRLLDRRWRRHHVMLTAGLLLEKLQNSEAS